MRVAVRRADNVVMRDFQAPGPAPGALAGSVAARYGGVAADYLEVEVPGEMTNPILGVISDPVWDGRNLSLVPHVKTQAELDAAAAAALATLREKLRTFDFSTITDLATAKGMLKDLRDFTVR